METSESFKAPDAAKVEGSKYVIDLQSGFFPFEKTLSGPNNGSKWYAKAVIPSTSGWSGSASFFIYGNIPNKDFRLKIFIPVVNRPSKYEGYGAEYATPLAVEEFAIVFNSDARATVYFKFNESTTNASIKCSHKNSTFEIVEEPSNVNWITSRGLHNTL